MSKKKQFFLYIFFDSYINYMVCNRMIKTLFIPVLFVALFLPLGTGCSLLGKKAQAKQGGESRTIASLSRHDSMGYSIHRPRAGRIPKAKGFSDSQYKEASEIHDSIVSINYNIMSGAAKKSPVKVRTALNDREFVFTKA